MLSIAGFLLVSAALVTCDWLLLARANPESRLPWNGWPPRCTWAHKAVIPVAVGCSFLTGTELIDRAGFVVAVLIDLAVLLVPLSLVTVVHNRRLRGA